MEQSNLETCTLYRPVGLNEMQLILEADARAFPPRLPDQPYFYPVLNWEYAEQIARDWNTQDPKSGFAGFVTQFNVKKEFSDQFEVHTVGSSMHRELWIPAEELPEFNRHIQGRIEIKAAYYGHGYKGLKHWYKDWYADEMFVALYRTGSPTDFSGEMFLNRVAIQLSFAYWVQHDFSQHMAAEEKSKLLELIAGMWRFKFPDIHLFGSEGIA